MSIRIPRSVFIRETASAPFASTDFAMSTMLVTFGESFTIRGFSVTSLTAFVTAPGNVAVSAESRSALFYVRAGYVKLYHVNSRAVELFCKLCTFFDS